jgi:hypothetical protein
MTQAPVLHVEQHMQPRTAMLVMQLPTQHILTSREPAGTFQKSDRF